MKTIGRTSPGRQRAGGLAALYLAAAYLLAMPFFLLVVDYPDVTDPVRKVVLLTSHHGSMHVMYLVTYVVFGIVLAVLALALHERLKGAAASMMRVATTVGLLWAFVARASKHRHDAAEHDVRDQVPEVHAAVRGGTEYHLSLIHS